jgi:miniconductance mechanosensitive channel
MFEYLSKILSSYGFPEAYQAVTVNFISLLLLLLLSWLSFYLARHYVVKSIERLVAQTERQWLAYCQQYKLWSYLAQLLPSVLVLVLAEYFFLPEAKIEQILTELIRALLCIQVAMAISALLNVINAAYQQRAAEKYLPINAAVQLIKLAIYLVALILAVAILIDKSPVYLLSGLGALTAVLLLIFQDTIKGLVASIQISANKMLAPGDWIEMAQYGADGDVLEIGLNTVKVQNFDRTVTTIPTYALISESFKNWREMYASGGRRIKRSLLIDIASINFCDEKSLLELEKLSLLAPYLKEKQQQLAQANDLLAADDVNQRKLTNIGTLRAYIEAYLTKHPEVNQQMTCMVRQLAPAENGLPLELYFFTKEKDWILYEKIMADIFDHLLAVTPLFGLRLFQHPSGSDWRSR